MSSPSVNWRNRIIRYRLEASQCPHCGTKHFPPRKVCYDCGYRHDSPEERMALKGTGVVLNYTIVNEAPPAFKLQKPYVMALIRLDEGLTVIGQIVDVDIDKIERGMKVRAVFRKLGEESKEGLILYGNKWTPI
ncbi:MAG: Zn-ribbon domain-containing OB-fold protein [Thermoplasmata archaeon]